MNTKENKANNPTFSGNGCIGFVPTELTQNNITNPNETMLTKANEQPIILADGSFPVINDESID